MAERRDCVGWTIDPQHIGIDAEEGLVANQRQRFHEATACFEQLFALVRDDVIRASPYCPALEMRFDGIGQIMDIDDGPAETRSLHLIQCMIEQRLARDAHERLGPCGRERTHTLAKARCHQHRRLKFDGHAARPPITSSPRALAGIFSANHAATGPRAGCARSRSSRPHMRGRKSR